MRKIFSLRISIYAKLGQCDSGHVYLPPLLGPRNRGLLVYVHAHSLGGFVKRAPYRPREITIYAPMIYTAPCVMFLMGADTLCGEVGGELALEI